MSKQKINFDNSLFPLRKYAYETDDFLRVRCGYRGSTPTRFEILANTLKRASCIVEVERYLNERK